MSDDQSELAFQEVDEALRRERMKSLWQRFGKYIIALAIGVVLLVAGREGWQAYEQSQAEAHSGAFAAALERAREDGADPVAVWRDALAGAEGELGATYGALARLRMAAAALDAGDVDSALSAYDLLIREGGPDRIIDDLARLLSGMVMVQEGRDLDAARKRFSTVAQGGRPWHHSGLEQLALLDLQQADMASARQRLESLVADDETPASIRQRAEDMEKLIGRELDQQSIDSEASAESPGDADGADASADTPR
ncbi:tetratricopeptide repeat protein [Yunchengibacter salinarum]|uniref:tetratricopeptide repeat protein n=1 Tax=Yunchengibacter salinarum TaxID=3133399 RepID=UPI0035B62644